MAAVALYMAAVAVVVMVGEVGAATMAAWVMAAVRVICTSTAELVSGTTRERCWRDC